MSKYALLLLIVVLVFSASAASASNLLGKQITAYVWLPSFKGEMSVLDSTEKIDAGFGDISDHMSFPIAVYAEYWPARWGFYLNFNYIGLEEESISDEQTQVTIVKNVDLVFIDFGAGYQFGPYPLGSDPDGPTWAADILGGGRYVWVQNVADYRAVDKLKGSSKFVDPVIGGRLRFYPSRNWAINLRGDIGGGAGADLMWNVILGANWQFADHWWLNFAYRGFDINYKPSGSSNEVGLDARVHGPIIGLSIAW
jgi:hypothetical protein